MNNIAIIGAGPSGAMAAIIASENAANQITLFDKSSLLQTLLCTGGGRCNLSYAEFDNRELAKFYPRGGKFLLSVFSQFSVEDSVEFFKNLGVETYTQPDNRIFPKSNKASDIRNALLKALNKPNIKTEKTSISDVEYSNNKFHLIAQNGKAMKFDNLVISTGGRGNGHKLAKKLSHSITPLRPALCSLVIKESTFKELSGLTLKNIKADVYFGGEKQFTQSGDFLFTHFGVSGPLVYKISSYAAFVDYSEITPLNIKLNLVNKAEDEFDKILALNFLNNGKKSLLNVISEYIPKSLAKAVLNSLDEDCEKKVSEVNKATRRKIASTLCCFELNAIKTHQGGEVVTAGGVDLNELNPKTLESKIIKNLFFCGEILNIDGLTGGFNLQNCWSSGFVVGNTLKDRI